MKNVGVFYHPSFSRKSYMTIGNRLRDFPEALEPVLQKPNVRLFEAPRVSEDLILKVHDPEMLEMVARDGFCATAYESVGSVVAGMEALAQGEIDRAFCFIGAGGHHAGYGQFWGACCFNDVVIALTHTREISRIRRLAIVDTDAHHADGTSQLIREDPEVFLLCFCGVDYRAQGGHEVDVNVYRLNRGEDANSQYLEKVRQHLPLVAQFQARPAPLVLWLRHPPGGLRLHRPHRRRLFSDLRPDDRHRRGFAGPPASGPGRRLAFPPGHRHHPRNHPPPGGD